MRYEALLPIFEIDRALPDLFHPSAVLTQIGVSKPGSGANMDQLLLRIQEEFAVVNKKGGVELDKEVSGLFLYDFGIFPMEKYLFESVKGGSWFSFIDERGYVVCSIIRRLT